MGALGETSTEEGSVESDKDPGAALEEDGAQEQTDPEENLEPRDNRHGCIIVLLDEGSDRLRKRMLGVLGFGIGRGSRGRGDFFGEG